MLPVDAAVLWVNDTDPGVVNVRRAVATDMGTPKPPLAKGDVVEISSAGRAMLAAETRALLEHGDFWWSNGEDAPISATGVVNSRYVDNKKPEAVTLGVISRNELVAGDYWFNGDMPATTPVRDPALDPNKRSVLTEPDLNIVPVSPQTISQHETQGAYWFNPQS